MKNRFLKWIAFLFIMAFFLQGCGGAGKVDIEYKFTGDDADKAGYAEGLITVSAKEQGSYNLYWGDDKGALEGYYAITELSVEKGKSAEYAFAYHTAIPAHACKVLAVSTEIEKEYPEVSDAVGVFDIPAEKQLGGSENAFYTFNSYSDVHIDEEKFGQIPAYWWEYSEAHWAQALAYAVKMNTDFIISSGDQVTNANFGTLDEEWKAYQLILAQSDYVKPVYESNGNHDLRQGGKLLEEMTAFIVGTGLDSNAKNLQEANPYYSIVEPNTGDLFIFMALEAGYRPAEYGEFSTQQLDWVENLLKENCGKGKNVYIIQHALINGYGPGDSLETPYYGGSMKQEFKSVERFISLLEEYKDVIWISGHSHLGFSVGYNYTNNNGEACNMIHNPSVSNPTDVIEGSVDSTFKEEASEGYFVQVFEKAIVFNGANLCDEKIYPAYSYIMDGDTSNPEAEEKSIGLFKNVDVTGGTLRSLMAHVNTVLGIYYEYSSYDQYQDLKGYYYQYKDADTYVMTEEELLKAYSELRACTSELHYIVSKTKAIEYTTEIVIEDNEAVVNTTLTEENE